MEYRIVERDNELYHHGILGMKWGVRRYQNEDGTLTAAGKKRYNKEVEKLKNEEKKIAAEERAVLNRRKTQGKLDALDAKKQELAARRKKLDDGDYGKEDDNEESLEDRRARIMRSTDPEEVYRNRDILTYQELSDRVNRINLETQLASKIPAKPKEKTALDRVDDIKRTVDKISGLYKSVDSAVSSVANSSIGKKLAKKLNIAVKEETGFDLDKFYKDMSKKTPAQLKEAAEAVKNQNTIRDEYNRRKNKIKADKDYAKKLVEEAAEAARAKSAKEAAQKAVDEYNERWRENGADDSVKSTTSGKYSYKKSDLSNATDNIRTTEYYPSVVNSSVNSATKSSQYSSGQDYANKYGSTTVTRMRDDDVEVYEPDWYKKMKRNGQL